MPQRSPAGSNLATLSEVPGTELRQLQASFESFRDFVARYSPWLSDSCIFVETHEEVPVGAPVRLEIWLRERPLLIRALGQVDWVRTAAEAGEEEPPGVALNITYLDPASGRLIDSIFRLYTGQQSAAMGKDVVETWELDVESLIDQAFPGAQAPGEPSSDTAPAAMPLADAAPPPASDTPRPSEEPQAETSQPAASAEVAPPQEETPVEPSSHEASLDWTLPEGVVVASPSEATSPPSEATSPPVVSPSEATSPPAVSPSEAASPPAAPAQDDSLDWTLPEGVVVADPGPPPAAPTEPDVAVEPARHEVSEVAEGADATEGVDDIGIANQLEAPELEGLEVPIELEALDDLEDTTVAEPAELEAPGLSAEVEAPSEPVMPETPVSPAIEADEPSTAVEPPEWAGSDAAALSAAAVSSAMMSGVTDSAAGGSDQAAEPMPESAAEDAEWEARLSSAFSEHDATESAEVVPQDAAQQEASTEVSGFGFGLVEDPAPSADEVNEEALPPLDDTATFTATPPARTSDPGRTVPVMPIYNESAPAPPAAQEPAAAADPSPAPPVTQEPAPPAAHEPAPLADSSPPVTQEPAPPVVQAPVPPVVQAPVPPVAPASSVAQAPLDGGPQHAAATPTVAGAASASDASDASFLQRSVLAFLLAVIAVGVLFWWFRGQQPTPSTGGPIAEVASGSGAAPEPVAPPAEPSGEATASGTASLPTGTASGEPEASEEPVTASPPAVETSATDPPTVASPPAVVPPPPSEASPTTIPGVPAAESGTGADPVATSPPASEPAAEPAGAQDPAAITAAVEQQIKTWASAWSRQDPDAYIASYGPDYSPPGLSRREWEQQRNVRIRAPASILVQAKDISVEVIDDSRAEATFYQDYETDTKHLYTWKTFELRRLPEGWRIVKERVGR